MMPIKEPATFKRCLMIIQKEIAEWISRPIFWPTSECQVSMRFEKKPSSVRTESFLVLTYFLSLLSVEEWNGYK